METTKKCNDCANPAVPGMSRCVPCAERMRQKAAERRAANANPPGKWNAAMATQRAKQYGAPGTWTDDEMSARAAMFKNVCVYCGGQPKVADHFKPLKLGGTNRLENLVPSCMPCNLIKLDAEPFDWLHETGKLEATVLRMLSASPTNPYATPSHPYATPTVALERVNPPDSQGNCSPTGAPTGAQMMPMIGIYTPLPPDQLNAIDGKAAGEWATRAREYIEARRGLVLTGPREPRGRMDRLQGILRQKGQGSHIATLSEVLEKDDDGDNWVHYRDVLMCPDMFDVPRRTKTVASIIDQRLAAGLVTVVHIKNIPQALANAFGPTVRKLLEKSHHYAQRPLPKQKSEQEKMDEYEAWVAQQPPPDDADEAA